MSVRTWGMSAFLNKILYSIHAAVDDRTGGQPDSGLPKPNRTGTVEMWRTAEAYLRCALFGSCRPRDVLSFCHSESAQRGGTCLHSIRRLCFRFFETVNCTSLLCHEPAREPTAPATNRFLRAARFRNDKREGVARVTSRCCIDDSGQ